MKANQFNEEQIKYILEMQQHAIGRKLYIDSRALTNNKFISGDRYPLEDFYRYFRKNSEPLTISFPDVFTRNRNEFVITGIAEDGISLEYFPITSENSEESTLTISTPKLFLDAANENENKDDASELIKAGLSLSPDIAVKLEGQLSDDDNWCPTGISRFNNGTTFYMYTNGKSTVCTENYQAQIINGQVDYSAPNVSRFTYIKK